MSQKSLNDEERESNCLLVSERSLYGPGTVSVASVIVRVNWRMLQLELILTTCTHCGHSCPHVSLLSSSDARTVRICQRCNKYSAELFLTFSRTLGTIGIVTFVKLNVFNHFVDNLLNSRYFLPKSNRCGFQYVSEWSHHFRAGRQVRGWADVTRDLHTYS